MNTSKPFLNQRVYTALKYLTQIGLPAFGTFYYTLSPAWNLPNAEGVSVAVLATVTFLGTLLGLSTAQYNKSDAKYDGVMNIGPDKNGLVLNDDLENLEGKKDLIFKVNAAPSGPYPYEDVHEDL